MSETLVSLDVYNQVVKERDIAIQQLHELGYEFGQKIEPTTKNDLVADCISRKAVQTRLKEIINEMETIFANIREREVDDSVCGLCEYDCDHGLDGFANECPGFEKDDCFKLNEKYRAEWLDISNLPSVTPQETRKGHWIFLNSYFLPYKCSECNYKCEGFNFCPNCGADMREVEK